MITKLPEGVTPTPPTPHDENDPAWARSHTLWNSQQGFDTRLHEERRLRYPRDATGIEQENARREWVLGQSFAMLEELGELIEALEAQNADEETVDTLHFTLSLAEKLGMSPEQLGRFEERFDAAATASRDAGDDSWEAALHRLLPAYVMAICELKAAHFKWWKNQPEQPDWTPQMDALRKIDHLNLAIASHVFPDAEAMYNRYMSKVQENHARQRGEVKGRETYKVEA